MSPDICRNPDNSITVSFTFAPGSSMLESELNLQAASNAANALATGECLKGFDTDGAPIEVGLEEELWVDRSRSMVKTT